MYEFLGWLNSTHGNRSAWELRSVCRSCQGSTNLVCFKLVILAQDQQGVLHWPSCFHGLGKSDGCSSSNCSSVIKCMCEMGTSNCIRITKQCILIQKVFVSILIFKKYSNGCENSMLTGRSMIYLRFSSNSRKMAISAISPTSV